MCWRQASVLQADAKKNRKGSPKLGSSHAVSSTSWALRCQVYPCMLQPHRWWPKFLRRWKDADLSSPYRNNRRRSTQS
jgi:hypothetical protein